MARRGSYGHFVQKRQGAESHLHTKKVEGQRKRAFQSFGTMKGVNGPLASTTGQGSKGEGHLVIWHKQMPK